MNLKNNIKILTQTAEDLHTDLAAILSESEPSKNLYEKALGEAESIALQLRVAYETLNPLVTLNLKSHRRKALQMYLAK